MPQRSEFLHLPETGPDLDLALGLSPRARAKRENQIRDQAIRIAEIAAASRRLIADYPSLAAWYCVSVRGRAERAVENLLEISDVEARVPRYRGDPIRKRGRIIAQPMLPVIPGYVLVQCVPSASAFRGIRGIEGVTGIVGRGEVPYRLSSRNVERFIDLADTGGYDVRPVEVRYGLGEMVRVADGPFASFHAQVIGLDLAATHGRINVEVHIFGRLARTEMDIAQIEKL